MMYHIDPILRYFVLNRKAKLQEVLWRYSLECLQGHIVPEVLQDLNSENKELHVAE